ncbi:MAG: winged helix-turn-helix domain-containing protein, partial [Pseudomonadota bacterium]
MIDRFSGLEVDWQAMELSRDGAQVPVKPKAFQLLEFLFANRDRVVSKYEIFETVWQGRFVSDGVLTTAVNDLRRALGDTGKKHHIIRTIYGQGLRFVADLENQEAADEVAPAEGTTVSEAALTASEIQSDPNSKVTVGLAVLALENLSTDPELSRLGDVVAEDLITALSKFSQLSVVSRTSSFAVSHQSTPLREIAETLGVDYIVEGSLRPVDDIARVSVQLIDASDDQHVWAEQFDWKVSCTAGEESMTFGVITDQLVDQLTRHEARSARHVAVEDLTAWQSYYRGIAALYTHRFAERNNAIAFFERA